VLWTCYEQVSRDRGVQDLKRYDKLHTPTKTKKRKIKILGPIRNLVSNPAKNIVTPTFREENLSGTKSCRTKDNAKWAFIFGEISELQECEWKKFPRN